MPDPSTLIQTLGGFVVAVPLLLVIALGLPPLFGWRLSERATSRSVQAANGAGLLASIAILGLMLLSGERHVPVEIGDWVAIPHFHFRVEFVFDRLSVPFAILSFALCGTIGAFAARYMHRERGFNRFHALYAIFLFGMVLTSLADTIETLFAGWELVGLSSALLVA